MILQHMWPESEQALAIAFMTDGCRALDQILFICWCIAGIHREERVTVCHSLRGWAVQLFGISCLCLTLQVKRWWTSKLTMMDLTVKRWWTWCNDLNRMSIPACSTTLAVNACHVICLINAMIHPTITTSFHPCCSVHVLPSFISHVLLSLVYSLLPFWGVFVVLFIQNFLVRPWTWLFRYTNTFGYAVLPTLLRVESDKKEFCEQHPHWLKVMPLSPAQISWSTEISNKPVSLYGSLDLTLHRPQMFEMVTVHPRLFTGLG